MDEIEKIKDILDYAKNHKAEEVMDKLKKLFTNDNAYISERDIDTAYYEEHTISIYPKNCNGMNFLITEGAFDRIGDKVSHNGVDITIQSFFGNDYITLFEESKQTKSLATTNVDKAVEYLSTNDFTEKTILSYFEDLNSESLVYNILPDSYKNSDEIIKSVIKHIEDSTTSIYEGMTAARDVSPYGGLDVYLKPKPQIFLEEINKCQNEKFKVTAKAYFLKDKANIDFLEKAKNQCNRYKYIASHASEYKKNFLIQSEINKIAKQYDYFQDGEINANDELQKLNNKLLELNIEDLSSKAQNTRIMNEVNKKNTILEKLSNQKYSFIDRFTKAPADNRKMASLHKEISILNEDLQINNSQIKYNVERREQIIKNMSLLEEISNLKNQLVKLEYPYECLPNDINSEFDYHTDIKIFDQSLDNIKKATNHIIEWENVLTDFSPQLSEKNVITVEYIQEERTLLDVLQQEVEPHIEELIKSGHDLEINLKYQGNELISNHTIKLKDIKDGLEKGYSFSDILKESLSNEMKDQVKNILEEPRNIDVLQEALINIPLS